jgi:hypothetical protein
MRPACSDRRSRPSTAQPDTGTELMPRGPIDRPPLQETRVHPLQALAHPLFRGAEAPRMNPILYQHLIQQMNSGTGRDTQPQIEVLTGCKRHLEASKVVEQRSRSHDRRGRYTIPPNQRVHGKIAAASHSRPTALSCPKFLDIAANNPSVWMRLHPCNLSRQTFGPCPVVIVEKGHPSPPRRPQPKVTRPGRSSLSGNLNPTKSRIVRRDLRQQVGGFIDRPVIDHKALKTVCTPAPATTPAPREGRHSD